MSFLLPCPNCGPRDVNEFAYAGEVTQRPPDGGDFRALTSYLYFRENVAGVQREWWYHRNGCETWFLAERDTRTNEVLSAAVPDATSDSGGRRPGPREADVPDTPAA